MTNNKEWEKVCREFCKKIDAKLLFVNNNDFGFESYDGHLVHMYADELRDILTKDHGRDDEVEVEDETE